MLLHQWSSGGHFFIEWETISFCLGKNKHPQNTAIPTPNQHYFFLQVNNLRQAEVGTINASCSRATSTPTHQLYRSQKMLYPHGHNCSCSKPSHLFEYSQSPTSSHLPLATRDALGTEIIHRVPYGHCSGFPVAAAAEAAEFTRRRPTGFDHHI